MPLITSALYSVTSLDAISEFLHTAHSVVFFTVALFSYHVFVTQLYSSTPLSLVIFCFHLSLVCADSRVPTAALYWYYVVVANSDPRRPFASVRRLQLPLLLRCPFSLTLYFIALSSQTFEEFVHRCITHTQRDLIRRSSTFAHFHSSAYPYFVDRRPPLTLISSFVDLSLLFRRKRMWQSTMYSPRYLLVDPHTYSSNSSFVVLLLILENILF